MMYIVKHCRSFATRYWVIEDVVAADESAMGICKCLP